jgi:hypothetical protein
MGGGSGIDRNGAQRNEDYVARGSRNKKIIINFKILTVYDKCASPFAHCSLLIVNFSKSKIAIQ